MADKPVRRSRRPRKPKLPRFRVLVYDLDESETEPTFDVPANAYIVATGNYDAAATDWDCKIRRAGSLGMLVHLADGVPNAIKDTIDRWADSEPTR